jgi:hypothetical protein
MLSSPASGLLVPGGASCANRPTRNPSRRDPVGHGRCVDRIPWMGDGRARCPGLSSESAGWPPGGLQVASKWPKVDNRRGTRRPHSKWTSKGGAERVSRSRSNYPESSKLKPYRDSPRRIRNYRQLYHENGLGNRTILASRAAGTPTRDRGPMFSDVREGSNLARRGPHRAPARIDGQGRRAVVCVTICGMQMSGGPT